MERIIAVTVLNVYLCLSPMDETDFIHPNIDDLFVTLTAAEPTNTTRPPLPGVITKNISINIEKLNMNRFRRKLPMFKEYILGTAKDDVGASPNVTLPSRRQTLGYQSKYLTTSRDVYQRTKVLDMILHLIYMSRHRVQQMIHSGKMTKYNMETTTPFRIAYIYRRLRPMRLRILDFYSSMVWWFWRNSYMLRHFLWQYQQAVRVHTDFIYYYKLMLKLHHLQQTRNENNNTLPTALFKRPRGR